VVPPLGADGGKAPDGAWVEMMLEFWPAAAVEEVVVLKVGRCRLTLSNPRGKRLNCETKR
jgi:hypothetical protein